jgi:acyl carrier protein phosphodiesterase
MVGNFIGDFVKGRNLHERFEPEIVRGIELHRTIDEYTDSHPVVSQSKQRLRAKYRHYAAVIVDVFYDHYLAHNWNLYNTIPLNVYADHAYATLSEHHSILPDQVQQMLPYMIKGNWLLNYSRIEVSGHLQAWRGVHALIQKWMNRSTICVNSTRSLIRNS